MIVSNPDDELIVGVIETSLGMHSFTIKQHLLTSTSRSHHQTLDIKSLAMDNDLLEIISYGHDKSSIYHRLSHQRCISSSTSFAIEFQALVNDIIMKYKKSIMKNSKYNKSSSSIPLILLHHLEDLGWSHIHHISHDMMLIHMKLYDASHRVHIIEVMISSDYPSSKPMISSSLPENIDDMIIWKPHVSSMMTIYDAGMMIISRYQALFDVLYDVDRYTWVLEPVQTSYAVLTRRIAIDTSTSIVIDIDRAHPYKYCEHKFLGPPDKIVEYRRALGQYMNSWSHGITPRLNIERALGIHFPPRETGSTADDNNTIAMECAICYTYALSSSPSSSSSSMISIPDEVCPNSKCKRVYHHQCLVGWLLSIPSTRSSFGTLFGSCPYCQDAISTKNVGREAI